jgi:hypothetical protein
MHAATMTRAEHRLGQVGDRAGEAQQHERDEARGEQPADLRACAHRVVDRRPRSARSDGQALRETRRDVGRAHRHELLADSDVLVAAAGERARGVRISSAKHTRNNPTAAGARSATGTARCSSGSDDAGSNAGPE